MGFWKEQSIAIDGVDSSVCNIKEKACFNTLREYTEEWVTLYYIVKDNLKTLGVKK